MTAKKCDSRKISCDYDKVYQDDVLFEAWKRSKANKGSVVWMISKSGMLGDGNLKNTCQKSNQN